MYLRRIREDVVEEVEFAPISGMSGGLSQMQIRAVGVGSGPKEGEASMNKYRERRERTGLFRNGKYSMKCSAL